MDDHRFDTLTRSLNGADSRRGVLTGLLGGMLGLLGLADAGAKRKKKKKHKKKKKRSPRDTCTPNCSGKNCGDDGCGVSCGTCSGGRTCQSGTCTCPTGQQDSGGVCGTPPPCLSVSAFSCFDDSQCCSNDCNESVDICECSEATERCHVTSDCCQSPTALTCVGFFCTA